MMEITKERDAALIGYNECRATIEDARIALKAHAHEGLLLAALRIQEELAAERALADRLADGLLSTLSSWMNSSDANHATAAIQAWKEARGE